jgi:hypothetical protein
MSGNVAAVLMLLILSPWIFATAWVAGGMFRDWLWWTHGIDIAGRWR